MKKIIGLFLGSFDPIHFGHINVVKKVLDNNIVDMVYMVPTPQNPEKDSPKADIAQRIAMIGIGLNSEGVDKTRWGIISGTKGGSDLDRIKDTDGKYYSYLQIKAIIQDIREAERGSGYDLQFMIICGEDTDPYSWVEAESIFSEVMGICKFPRTPESSTAVRNGDTNLIPKSVLKFMENNGIYQQKEKEG